MRIDCTEWTIPYVLPFDPDMFSIQLILLFSRNNHRLISFYIYLLTYLTNFSSRLFTSVILQLVSEFPHETRNLQMPGKTLFANLDPQFVNERKTKLEHYLNQVIRIYYRYVVYTTRTLTSFLFPLQICDIERALTANQDHIFDFVPFLLFIDYNGKGKKNKERRGSGNKGGTVKIKMNVKEEDGNEYDLENDVVVIVSKSTNLSIPNHSIIT